MRHFVRIGGAKVFLDEAAFAEGLFELAEGTLSEQCGECAEDIADTGTLYANGEDAMVLCDSVAGGCEAEYRVEREE